MYPVFMDGSNGWITCNLSVLLLYLPHSGFTIFFFFFVCFVIIPIKTCKDNTWSVLSATLQLQTATEPLALTHMILLTVLCYQVDINTGQSNLYSYFILNCWFFCPVQLYSVVTCLQGQVSWSLFLRFSVLADALVPSSLQAILALCNDSTISSFGML